MEKKDDLKSWLNEKGLNIENMLTQLKEKDVTSLKDLKDLSTQQNVDELVNDMALDKFVQNKLSTNILELIGSDQNELDAMEIETERNNTIKILANWKNMCKDKIICHSFGIMSLIFFVFVFWGFFSYCMEFAFYEGNDSVYCDIPYQCSKVEIDKADIFSSNAYKGAFNNYKHLHKYTISSLDQGFCQGSYSCSNNKIVTWQLYCYGGYSCINTKLREIVSNPYTLRCDGYYACFNSYISMSSTQGTGETKLECNGANSCINAYISEVRLIEAFGMYSMKNGYVNGDDGMQIQLIGYHSGYNLTIYCSDSDVCNINCQNQGCYLTRLLCDSINNNGKCDNFNVNCLNEKNDIYCPYFFNNTTAIGGNSNSSTIDIYNNNNSSSNHINNIVYDLYDGVEVDLVIFDWNKSNIYCRSYYSCWESTIRIIDINNWNSNQTINIGCGGCRTCVYPNWKLINSSNSNIICNGRESCQAGLIESISNHGYQKVFCHATSSCYRMKWIGLSDIYCVGYHSCDLNTFISVSNIYIFDKYRASMNIYSNGSNVNLYLYAGNSSIKIYCNEKNDNCNIECYSIIACDNVIIEQCEGNCTIWCKFTSSSSIYKISSINNETKLQCINESMYMISPTVVPTESPVVSDFEINFSDQTSALAISLSTAIAVSILLAGISIELQVEREKTHENENENDNISSEFIVFLWLACINCWLFAIATSGFFSQIFESVSIFFGALLLFCIAKLWVNPQYCYFLLECKVVKCFKKISVSSNGKMIDHLWYAFCGSNSSSCSFYKLQTSQSIIKSKLKNNEYFGISQWINGYYVYFVVFLFSCQILIYSDKNLSYYFSYSGNSFVFPFSNFGEISIYQDMWYLFVVLWIILACVVSVTSKLGFLTILIFTPIAIVLVSFKESLFEYESKSILISSLYFGDESLDSNRWSRQPAETQVMYWLQQILIFETIYFYLFLSHSSMLLRISSIFVSFISSLFDLFTDFLIVYIWYESNLISYAWLQLSILIIAQIISCIFINDYELFSIAINLGDNTMASKNNNANNMGRECFERFIILLGLGRLWFGFQSFYDNESMEKYKTLKIFELLLESIPSVTLSAYILIADDNIRKNNANPVIGSMFVSFVNITLSVVNSLVFNREKMNQVIDNSYSGKSIDRQPTMFSVIKQQVNTNGLGLFLVQDAKSIPSGLGISVSILSDNDDCESAIAINDNCNDNDNNSNDNKIHRQTKAPVQVVGANLDENGNVEWINVDMKRGDWIYICLSLIKKCLCICCCFASQPLRTSCLSCKYCHCCYCCRCDDSSRFRNLPFLKVSKDIHGNEDDLKENNDHDDSILIPLPWIVKKNNNIKIVKDFIITNNKIYIANESMEWKKNDNSLMNKILIAAKNYFKDVVKRIKNFLTLSLFYRFLIIWLFIISDLFVRMSFLFLCVLIDNMTDIANYWYYIHYIGWFIVLLLFEGLTLYQMLKSDNGEGAESEKQRRRQRMRSKHDKQRRYRLFKYFICGLITNAFYVLSSLGLDNLPCLTDFNKFIKINQMTRIFLALIIFLVIVAFDTANNNDEKIFALSTIYIYSAIIVVNFLCAVYIYWCINHAKKEENDK